MLIVPVEQLVEGDLLGRGVYAADGRLMLKEGITLNDRLIEGIKRLGQRYIFVAMTEHRAASEDCLDTLGNLIRLTQEMLQQIFQSIRQMNNFPSRSLLEWSDHVTEIVASNPEMTISMKDLVDSEDSELVSHSLNVCFLSLMTAKALGYNKTRLVDIAIGSLLHDIGLVLPHDHTLLMHHPMVGYDMLRKVKGIPEGALRIVLQHHEQIDGRGFPYGIRETQLDEGAQICGIASEFDYFMNDRITHRLPSEGIDMVMSKIDTFCSYAVGRAFIHAFHPYQIGTVVKLNGGLTGVVRTINKANASRPVVQLDGCDARIDLMTHTTFRIEQVLHQR